ncbi:aminoglycoside N(3)-acetyltransferase [Desmospora activa]|uniref:Aminoglycoside N(3)-acetyltransferase n=1 Tax=Desmospora activa DSM 45169 TaxID=1121389 RepID=A0A2T4ZC83_9BACL|nr:AAC(3) family N-acetyltransferase [Desmospora activa]PTM59495.1 aminoglycoside 3-N-acetyltransferase [Desmospora activa DSM 45169]
MGQTDVEKRSELPQTRVRVRDDLRKLGVSAGEMLMVHSSLSSLGYVVGGAQTVVEALMEVVTPTGTLVMPSQSGDWSDPARWEAPPVPESWWQTIRAEMPAYNPRLTPVLGMGQVVEQFLKYDAVFRSPHPKLSFAAWGAGAEELVRHHPLDDGLSDHSPLGEMYRKQARVLFLGTDYHSCTAFHLAEHRAGVVDEITDGAPVLENDQRRWKWYRDFDYRTDCFAAIGEAWERRGNVIRGKVGSAEVRLFPLKEAVDFAEEWLRNEGSRK